MTNTTMESTHGWHEYVDDDLETHPSDGADILAEFENGARTQAHYAPDCISLHGKAPAGVDNNSILKRWRYLNRPEEARLGINQSGGLTVNTFHISHSTIANLNLGNVIGDLNGSIQQLNSGGHNELGSGLGKMAEAVAESKDLQDLARKEVLEHLVVVSDEAAKPPEQRKVGPLKTSISAIKSGIGMAAQLVEIWQSVEHGLKAAGIIQG